MNTLRREVQVAFSPNVQPMWFRLVKWGVILLVTARYRQRRWFPYAVSIALVLALSLHMGYRWKTHGWTQAWGGWDDVPQE